MAHLSNPEFQALRIAVLTVSDTRNLASDGSGQTLIEALEGAGHALAERALVPDDIWQIRARLCAWVADPLVQVVLITGGTGFTARDNTPQAVAPLLDKMVDGFGELFRQISLSEIGTSTVQSRGKTSRLGRCGAGGAQPNSSQSGGFFASARYMCMP